MTTSNRPKARMQIVARRTTQAALELDLRCPACDAVFTIQQPTILGLTLGAPRCPGCGESASLHPIEPVADETNSPATNEHALDREARRIANTWHQHGQFPTALTHRGVNLGAGAAHILQTIIRAGLSETATSSEAGR